MSIRAFVNSLNNTTRIQDAMQRAKPDYASNAIAGLREEVAQTQWQAEQNAANVRTAASNATDVALVKDDLKTKEKVRAIDKRTKMAGALAGGASLIAAGVALKNKKQEVNPMLDLVKKQQSFWQNQYAKGQTDLATATQALADFNAKTKTGDSTLTTPSNNNSGASTTVTTGVPTSNLGGQSFDLSKLTDNDYKELGYAISSEAALGTDDEFGVAANILTRLQSGKYGNNISDIIRAKGQYEGVYTGKSVYSPEIEARLKSPEGQQKIQKYFNILDGRTEFKGQSMLKNRVAAEDPMFDPKGNFYHYSWQ